ncbi:bacterial transcriptional activator domain-containing protein [Paenibacillus macquariensis]|uniref:bacterial transcriptional activator domain-containing protein n=1 Tax=Paenibacillus macquariensis TaxID=948756 RepID=UPI001483A3DC|nr:bacterial transcriptional activator domain-containing protein [Paenibacillus macquariensis]MEC0090704.1 bacterial transcriptional activator domain-containing protein [Paenibacillus macquariensis]
MRFFNICGESINSIYLDWLPWSAKGVRINAGCGHRIFPWARSEVEHLSLMYTSFTQRLCEALLIRGDTQTAIRLVMKLINRNKLEEGTIMLYLRALALTKSKESLNRQYIQFEETLYRELGITPFSKVSALFNQLMSELGS